MVENSVTTGQSFLLWVPAELWELASVVNHRDLHYVRLFFREIVIQFLFYKSWRIIFKVRWNHQKSMLTAMSRKSLKWVNSCTYGNIKKILGQALLQGILENYYLWFSWCMLWKQIIFVNLRSMSRKTIEIRLLCVSMTLFFEWGEE